MKLIIFDLDQTLVDFSDLHSLITHDVLKKHFGVEASLDQIEHAGRSQRDGLLQLALLNGVTKEQFEQQAEDLLVDFGVLFSANMPDNVTDHVLPGAVEVLSALKTEGHILVLYTGDAPGVVEAVMNATELGRFFSLRFSGTQFEKREDMVKAAIARVAETTGKHFTGTDVVIVGDSPRDVACALILGVRVIGVAAGSYTTEELQASGAVDAVSSLLEVPGLI